MPGRGSSASKGRDPTALPCAAGLVEFFLTGWSYGRPGSWGSSSSPGPAGGDPALLLEAHHALGTTLNYLGEFAAAQAHLEQGIALYDPQQHRAHAFRYGQDPGVVAAPMPP